MSFLADRVAGADEGWPIETAIIEPSKPSVFVRTLSTPAAPPWDQSRAAALEAKLGAPLPLSEIDYQVRRLEGWRFGRPGRFAACYVRTGDIRQQLETTSEIDGHVIKLLFVTRAERTRRARLATLVSAAGAGMAVLLFAAVALALSLRVDAETRLAALEQSVAIRLRAAHRLSDLKVQAQRLNAAGVHGSGVDQVLRDLAWASSAKAPDAHIDAFHWQRGYLGVEVRGPAAPLLKSDRTVEKAPKPLRPGVWLWGVAPASRSMREGR